MRHLADYEDLEREDIPAALDYATQHLKFPQMEAAQKKGAE